MQTNIYRSFSELASLSGEWNDILSCCSASHVPFLRYEYLSNWWTTLGGGEWSQGELYVVTIRDDDGKLLGIAPLFYSQNRDNLPALLLLGSIEISDYLDLIVRTSDSQPFLTTLFETLARDARLPNWQVLDWYNIPEDSPTLAGLAGQVEPYGWQYQQQRLQPSVHIPLPGDWEVYLAGIDKKQRHEIRRKMRRAEESTIPLHWYIVQDAASLEAEMEAFLDLMAQDPAKARFLSPAMRQQMKLTMQTFFQLGWLQLAFLEINGSKAAGYLNFDYNGHIWVYNSGLNFDYRELSPGWVLLGYLLKWANDEQRAEFDFMRGDEDYKYRFGGINRYIARITIRR
jgi:CelD/BcsL family acetyltransferase involved in cellulose biosynthesis